MSSPGPGPGPGSGNWPTPSAESSEQTGYNSSESSGVIIKPMRLKILYTFDGENKTNCLARWPYVLQIQTVSMNDSTTIGVVELKTCIQAIVQCSPELVAKQGQDYTVYAFDYSESDTPLVGQGMLSWALSTTSQSPEALESRQLITGRVCKNIQALFSNGVAETLEVKLRLVPVPTILQSEYLNSLEKYNQLSKVMPVGFDHKEWYSFIQANPNFAQMANLTDSPTSNALNQRNGISMEVVNQLLSPNIGPQTHIDSFNTTGSLEAGDLQSRAPTPSEVQKIGKSSRPSSRASVKRPRKPRAKSVAASGNTSGYEEEGDDGSTTKKRAKITKTNWNSKSSFGSASDSLRVAASTSGSLRMFRPIAIAPPGANPGNHLQELPRAPTPIPDLPIQAHTQDRTSSQVTTRRDSMVSQFLETHRSYNSPYAPPDDGNQRRQEQIQMSIESAVTSPEQNDSSSGTPPDIGSSPPMLRMGDTRDSSPQLPSSPVLPQMPRTDSGFMSGDIDDLFEDDADIRRAEVENVATSSKYNRRRQSRAASQRAEVHHGFAIEEVTPGPPELLPTKMLFREDPKSRKTSKAVNSQRTHSFDSASNSGESQRPCPSASNSSTGSSSNLVRELTLPIPSSVNLGESSSAQELGQADRGSEVPVSQAPLSVAPSQLVSFPRPPSRLMSRTASAGSLTLPTVAASDPVLPPTTLQHAQTWSETAQPSPDFSSGDPPPPPPQSSNSNVHRASLARNKKENIRMRLEEAVARGEQPPFCSNCGAIETPTWRKAWARECKGDPGYHEYSELPGKVTAIDILERDEVGKPITYKLIKKSLLPDEDRTGFEEILLCNPCGIWMSKYKTQRPEEKWQKDQRDSGQNGERKTGERRRHDRPSRSKKSQQGPSGPSMTTSEAYCPSDILGSIDYDTSFDTFDSFHNQAFLQSQEGLSHNERQRSLSVHPTISHTGHIPELAPAGTKQQAQSSPARWVGTQHSPVDIEDDLGSTRRLLFPSPRKDGVPKILGEVAVNIVRSATDFRPVLDQKSAVLGNSNKENRSEMVSHETTDVEILKLFEEEIARPARPSTPPPKQSADNSFKTPVRPTPNHRPVTRSQSQSARSATKIQMLPQRTPSKTPSTTARRRSPRFNRTPIETPFTATLNQLLSEANNTSPSRNLDLGFDFSALPDLGHSVGNMDSDLNFQIAGFEHNQDFFSTDFPMPSSPPRLFDGHDDPMSLHGLGSMDSTMWSDFGFEDSTVRSGSSAVMINSHRPKKDGPRGSIK